MPSVTLLRRWSDFCCPCLNNAFLKGSRFVISDADVTSDGRRDSGGERAIRIEAAEIGEDRAFKVTLRRV